MIAYKGCYSFVSCRVLCLVHLRRLEDMQSHGSCKVSVEFTLDTVALQALSMLLLLLLLLLMLLLLLLLLLSLLLLALFL